MAKGGLMPDCGDHICAVYTTKAELAAVAATFLAEGLKRRERCWYVAAGSEGGAVRRGIAKRGVEVDAESRRSALTVVTDAYVAGRAFEPERTVQVFSDAIEQALKDGFTGFRAAADMSWALDLPDGAERLITYEALLKSLFLSARATGLCLYDSTRMPLAILNGALCTHPLIHTTDGYEHNECYDAVVKTLPTHLTRNIAARLARLGVKAAS